jgi:DNA damage-binding protein 1
LALALAVKGDIVIVGDLMKSICMLHYNSETFKLSLFARDYETRWITALETIDDRVVIGDSQRNVVVLVKDPNSKKMIVDAKFHLGDMVNRFRAGILIYNIGSIVMRAGDLPTAATPVLLFGTVHGTLGVLATLKDENFAILDKLQVEMGKLPSVGNLSNQE